MKLTEASAGKIRSSRRPLPEIEPQSSKESLIQKILEIKSTGKTVVKSLQVAFEEQLMTPLDRIKDIKEYTCISLSNYTRNVRSLISGIHEFLPEHALGVEKCFKGNVQLIDFMMDWYSAELRKVQDNLDNHSESGVKTAEYVKTIDNLRERLANVEHQHKSKLERMKDQLSNNHQLIKLYEMELNQKTTEKNYY